MANWVHSTILATTLVATVAVGVASASLFLGVDRAAPRAARLPVIADARAYVTVETRQNGGSILNRIQLD